MADRAGPARGRRAVLRAFAGTAAAAVPASRDARAARPADLPGWAEARWGMTPAALDRSFAGRIRTVAPLAFGPFTATRIIDRVRLGAVPFVVFFQARPPDTRLAQVLLQFRGSRPTAAEVAATRAALEAQLGPADAREGAADYSGSFPSATLALRWDFPTTRVVLRFVDPDGENDRRVRKELLVRYTPRRQP